MSQTIPLSRLSTVLPSSSYHGSQNSPDGPDYQDDPRYDDTDEVQRIAPSWQKDIYMLLEKPTSSQAAFLIHVFTTFLICFSAVVTVLETVQAFHSIPASVWFGLETALSRVAYENRSSELSRRTSSALLESTPGI